VGGFWNDKLAFEVVKFWDGISPVVLFNLLLLYTYKEKRIINKSKDLIVFVSIDN